MDAVLAAVRAQLGRLKVPGPNDKVYKGECQYTFNTPESPGGLYINLITRQSFSPGTWLAADRRATGAALYLHETWKRVPAAPSPVEAAAAAPTKLAIGLPGGFAVDEPTSTLEKTHALVVFTGPPGAGEDAGPHTAFPFPSPEAAALPEYALTVASAVLEHTDSSAQEAAMAWEDAPIPTKYADSLIQEVNGVKISPNPSDWHCNEPGCDKSDNLWLNLGDGFIGCGRRNFDGSGGNGHALAHYEATGGVYPLCVKLGTITPAGGDVFSYAPDEGDMVTNPHLARHLAHWGVNIMACEKTEKSMAELNVALNQQYDFSLICESGKELVPATGPGFLGLENLGNTCYMASVAQTLLGCLPEAGRLYGARLAELAASLPPSKTPADDLLLQMAKLSAGLFSSSYAAAPGGAGPAASPREAALTEVNAEALAATGATSADASALTHVASVPPVPAPGAGGACGFLVPRTFRALVGRGHPDFSSAKQQDAQQFLEWLFDLLDKAHHAATSGGRGGAAPIPTPSGLPVSKLPELFEFVQQMRLLDTQSGGLRYTTAKERTLRLGIPLDAAINKEEVEAAKAALAAQPAEPEAKRPKTEGGVSLAVPAVPKLRVPFEAVLAAAVSPSTIEGFKSPATGQRGAAVVTTRFASWPRYLWVQMARYTLAPDWTTVKVDASVPMPLHLDLEAAGLGLPAGQALGLQPGEAALDEGSAGGAGAPTAGASAAVEPDALMQAQLESFGFPSGACARALVATHNAGVEAAMEHLLAHTEDADFAEPYVAPAPAAAAPVDAPAPVDEGAVAMVCEMGFEPSRAAAVLRYVGGDVERAVDWLFNHPDEAVPEPAGAAGGAAAGGGAGAGAPALLPASAAGDLPTAARGRYSLLGFVSHMGASPNSGHYVCHLRKDPVTGVGSSGPSSKWYIFNDAKVAESAEPPLDLGYLYLFKRDDWSA